MCDDDHSGSTRAVSGAKVIDLTEFPGEFPKQHDAYAWNQKAKGRLGNLLAVAQGEWPAAALSIVDTNIDSIPELPADHPHHHARLEARLKIQKEIDQNRIKRNTILMQERTNLFASLSKSVENTAPVLHKELHNPRTSLC